MINRWPLLVPLLCMIAGMSLALIFDYSCTTMSVVPFFVLLCIAALSRKRQYFDILVPVFFFIWGFSALTPWLHKEVAVDSVIRHQKNEKITIEGVVSGRPVITVDGGRLFVEAKYLINDVSSEPVSGNLLLLVTEGAVSLSRGDRIRFISKVEVPRLLGLPGEFNYQRYLAFNNIDALCRVKNEKHIVLVKENSAPSLSKRFDDIAIKLAGTVIKGGQSSEVSSVINALVLGDQKRIPPYLSEAYTRAGVNHILSVSGFHVGILAAFVSALIAWLLTRFEYLLLRYDVRTIALVTSLPAMFAYLLLTGSAPATSRAVIMLAVFVVAILSTRARNLLNALIFSATLLIAINPPTLFDVSFQLSFLALWGLIIADQWVSRVTATLKSVHLRSIIRFIAASAAASAATAIPVLYIFKSTSINGLLTNFLIVPLLGYGAVIVGFISLPIAAIFPQYSAALLWPVATLVDISNRIILWCNSLPVITSYAVNGWDMLFFLLFMLAVTFFDSRTLKIASAAALVSLSLLLHFIPTVRTADGKLKITMLSVGQSESILLNLPDGSTLLVDGGGYLQNNEKDFGKGVLAPALGAMGVMRIDRVIATHKHPDHSGGLPYIIRNFHVKELYTVPDIDDKVLEALNSSKASWSLVGAGDLLDLPQGVSLSFLSPDKTDNHSSHDDSVNDQSLVFRLTYRKFSMLFTGDTGFAAEESILSSGMELKSTVLKTGHHGSRHSTSESFLKKVQPEAALISSGYANRFGLPAKRTLELLESNRIKVFRTDMDGSIQIVTDGISWNIATFNSGGKGK